MRAGSRLGRSSVLLSWVFLTSLALPAPPRGLPAPDRTPADAAGPSITPQVFEANLGQAGGGTLFLSRADGLMFRLEAGGIAIDQLGGDGTWRHSRLEFAGAQAAPTATGVEPLEGTVSYFAGSDRRSWIEGAPTFAAVRYRGLAPGTELTVRGDHRGLRIEVELAPGVDPEAIPLALTDAGDVDGRAAAERLRLQRQASGRRLTYTLDRNGRPAASVAIEATRVVVDPHGATWLSGRTLAVPGDDPVSLAEAFVTRIDRGAASPSWTVYFGGAGRDLALALASSDDALLVVGRTESDDFPQTGPRRQRLGASDGFALSLPRDGSGPIAATLLGGPGEDEVRAVAVDTQGTAWMGGTSDGAGFLAALSLRTETPPRSIAIEPVASLSVDAIATTEPGRVLFAGARRAGTAAQPYAATLDGAALSFSPLADDLEGSVTGLLARDDGSAIVIGRRTSPGTNRRLSEAAGFVAFAGPKSDSPVVVKDVAAAPLAIAAAGDHALIGGDRGGAAFMARVSAAEKTLEGLHAIPRSTLGGVTSLAIDSDRRIVLAGVDPGPDSDDVTGADHAVGADAGGPPPRLLIAAARGGLAEALPLSESAIGLAAAGCPGTIRFDNSAGTGLWQTATNWSTDILPGAADDVCIPAGSTVTLSNGTHSVSTLFVETGASLTITLGNLNLAASSQVNGTLNMSGGSIGGAGDVAIASLLNWSAGAMTGAGITDANGGIAITGASVKDISGSRILVTHGTVTWTGTGSIRMGTGGVIRNQGTWDAQNNATITLNLGGTASFDNQATRTFKKTVGTGITTINVPFTSDGAISIETGTFDLSNGGSVNGTITGLPGTTLRFSGGTSALSSTSNVSVPNVAVTAGTVTVDGVFNATTSTANAAVFTFNAASTVTTLGSAGLTNTAGTLTLNTGEAVGLASLTLSGGTLQGTDNVSVSGPFAWSGGELSGAATTTANGTVTITAATAKDVTNSRLFVANSATSWSGTGPIRTGSGARIRNASTWESTTDATMTFNLGGAAPAFENLPGATFTKKTATGVTTLNLPVTNDGTLSIETGTLALTGGGTLNGPTSGLAGATLRFAGGSFTLSAGSSVVVPNVAVTTGTVNISGAYTASATTISGGTTTFLPAATLNGLGSLTMALGTLDLQSGEAVSVPTLDFTGGTLQGSDTVTVAGATNWSAGAFSGSGVTNLNGPLTITGASVKDITAGRTLNVAAATSWSGTGGIRMGGGAVLHNSSTWTALNDTAMTANLGGSGRFDNQAGATFRKSTGVDSTLFTVVFDNEGTLDIQTGTITFSGGGTSTGSIAGASGTTVQNQAGSYELAPGSSTSIGALQVSAGTLTGRGTFSATGTTVTGGTLAFLPESTLTTLGSSLTQSNGTLDLQSGETVNLPTLTFSGGTLQGTDTVSVAGATNWSGGTFSGSAVTNLNGPMTITGAGNKDVTAGRTLNVTAATSWSGIGSVRLGGGAVIHNSSTWTALSDALMSANIGGSGRFDNQAGATFRKSTGVGSSMVTVVFDNDGTLDIQTGTITFSGGGTSTGSIVGASGTTVQNQAGSYELAPGSSTSIGALQVSAGTLTGRGTFSATGTTVTGGTLAFLPESTLTSLGTNVSLSFGTLDLRSGEAIALATLSVSSGTLKGSDTVSVSGAMNWSGGTLTEAGILNANGGVIMSSAGTKDISGGRVLNIAGTSTWAGNGSIRIGTGGIIHNAGTLTAQTDAGITANIGGTGAFDNQASGGVFVRTAGAGTSSITVDVTNAGTMKLQAGSTALSIGSFTQTGGLLSVESPASLSSTNTLQIQGGTLGGTGTITANVNLTNAHLAPGTSPGSLAINGTLTETALTAMDVEIGGLTPGSEHDRAVLSAAPTIAGTLNVSLVNGFVPADLNTFTILTFPSATGTFATVNTPILPGGLVWQIFYTPTTVFLKVIADLDGDGVSNLVDCAPADASAWAVPAEVTNVVFATNNQTVSWNSLATQAGPGTIYDLMRGLISQLPVGDKPAETCLAPDSGSTQFVDNATPAVGAGFYYLVRGSNVCGVGNYGTTSGGAPRLSTVCP
ncbi:MAG TPA: hypothetical protein VFC25_13365 [Verrucomicrobiae bacterium]|nr:hypothetical protein [Verrucomicrobiae bacterium]